MPPDEQLTEGPDEAAGAEGQHTRVGLTFFALYLFVYGAFVVLNAFSPAAMDAMPVSGVNLAVLYGMALIVGALVLAVIYAALRGRARSRTAGATEDGRR